MAVVDLIRRPRFDFPAVGARRAADEPGPKHDFRAMLGAAGWARLHPAVRDRFAAKAAAVTYRGVMRQVDCSAAGYLLAQLCRLFGTPLAPFRGAGVPMTADVRLAPDGAGIVWRRVYRFPGRAPVTVRSTKLFGHDGGLSECVGGGFGMDLAVFEQGGAMHFLSTRYFWRLGPIRLPLPALLTPGATLVVHADAGGGRFRFTMTVDHPWLGRTYYQDGIFEDTGVTSCRPC